MSPPQGLSLRNVVVERSDKNRQHRRLLDIPALDIAPGQLIGISGPSGAGKSTLIEVISGMTRPTAGDVDWGTIRLARLSEAKRDHWRQQCVGLIFQDFHLIPELSVEQNVLLPQRFGRFRLDARLRARARQLIDLVGLHHPGRVAGVLSRGEQQRVAIARALLKAPPLIMADEPTASLDPETARDVADLIIGEARRLGATLIVVSHDPAVLDRLDLRLCIVAGQIVGGEA